MEENIEMLIRKLLDKEETDPYKYGDQLARINSKEVADRLISIVKQEDMDNAFIAARVLTNMEDKPEALEAILEVIHQPKNKNKNGGLVSTLENYDLSAKFVDILKIYLFGNYKSSTLAKELLDHTEFDINARTLKKAEKHWKHYENNARADDSFELKKTEVETIFEEIRSLLESQ